MSDDVRRAAVMASQPLVGTRAQGHGQGFDIQDLYICHSNFLSNLKKDQRLF